MSIFSRLLKRGPEDGGTPPPEPSEPPAAAKPAPAPREASPAPAPGPAPSASKNGTSHPEPKPAPANSKAAMGVTKAYQAVKPLPGSTAAAPGMVPPRNTPPRTTAAAATPATPPPPAPTSKAAAPGATTAAALAVAVAKSPAREEDSASTEALTASGSVELMFEKLFPGTAASSSHAPAASASSDGVLAASDRKAVMATFEELAVGHTAQVRSFMLEVRWGEAQTSWIELARPALKSLRAMAVQMEHTALITALDGFDAALEEMLRPGAPPAIGPVARDKLCAAYEPLMVALPRAFELEGERDRREPMVVRALLQQVDGLDPLMIDKMTAAGLGRLETLFRAKADEIAAVAGIAPDVAAATAARVQAFRRATPAVLATPDLAATARELTALYEAFEADHRAFEDAARGWSEGDREAKKRLRRQRELGFLQITVALARLGEIDLALRLEKCPFARRLEELERLVSRMAPLLRAPVPSSLGGDTSPVDGQIRKIDREVQSGAHAAP